MATVTTMQQLIAVQQARFARVQKTAASIHRWTATEGHNDLVELTSGNISKNTLAKLGYPFARGLNPNTGAIGMRGASRARRKAIGFKGSVPLLPINKQSNRLHGGLFMHTAGRNIFDVGSSAPHAKYIFHFAGTRKMVGRGIMGGKLIGGKAPGALEKRWRRRNAIIAGKFRNIHKP